MAPLCLTSASSQPKWSMPSYPLVHIFLLLILISTACKAQLNYNFYGSSCPNLAGLVRATITANLVRDPTVPAALLRLFFHDCQVQGCDGSILLDSQGGIDSERAAAANLGIRRLEFIDAIKASVERMCPNTVSCADLVVLAAREAVRITGGPFIEVPLGRRDGVTASSARAEAELPSAETGFAGFLQVFQSKGMTLEESVAILGAHTLGVGHCASVVNRLYPQRDRSIGPLFYSVLRLRCPARGAVQAGGGAVLPNDITALAFDTQYFSNAVAGRGLFRVDAEVARNPLTAPIVRFFNNNPAAFFQAFSSAFVKLSLSNVLTASQGEIRRNCRLVN
ncbi:hypothetical protein GOP47_0000779 [Adiantum capillus-veneris]|uniref:Peroxidase n=1 Tax=Adiantum capillus-veneris TaxID=13818 RepID=A0A9D4ZTE0_ADICA|nr:hypothetical protein GOP47_0000779 [Adiantum capillus-veneris]